MVAEAAPISAVPCTKSRSRQLRPHTAKGGHAAGGDPSLGTPLCRHWGSAFTCKLTCARKDATSVPALHDSQDDDDVGVPGSSRSSATSIISNIPN